MRTHVALLRGINVGGRRKVPMADLRDLVRSLGHEDVATYVQSGNVVFTSAETDAAALAASLERAIAELLGVTTDVVVLSRDELAAVIDRNPYPDETNPKALHAVLRQHEPDSGILAGIALAQERARAKGSPDEATVVEQTLYLRLPDGMGRSELAAQLARAVRPATGGGLGTARNWATVTALMGLMEG